MAAGGLCLPHFTETLTHASGAASQSLADWQAAAFRRLRDELDELIRKHDYRFSGETITEQEAVAWTRAVAAAVGEASCWSGNSRPARVTRIHQYGLP